ncbi:MAG: bifunctional folylpolyglutamate synthase/dihydrofolate synthase [Clostridia bacterium]|nr:bifunctional folylpolyglutamate synthase/dihydrofolate synthase [Clostridia bacterium]
MNYDESLSFIHSRLKFGSRPGMERISALCEAFGDPQNELKFVHVAGTNGKGSVCWMISSVLSKAGYKTGLFTSPYVVDFRERIQIDGRMIGKEEFASVISEIKPVTERLSAAGIEPTEFEIITLAAFLCFKKQGCDIVVLETGLGGKLDSTNIISSSEVSVITSISMDHTEVLGDTLLKIAGQKCGIFKQGGTVVSYPQKDFAIERYIKDRAKEAGCDYVQHELSRIRLVQQELDGSTVIYSGCTFKIPLTGKHQIYNFATAAAALIVLKKKGYEISRQNMIDGISSLSVPARTEIVSRSPLVIIDGGHNAEGMQALCDTVRQFLSDRKIIAVFGIMRDKDYRSCIAELAPLCSRMYATTPSNPRSLPSKELAGLLKPYCKKVKAVEDPAKAYAAALKKCDKDSAVIVCGSLYLAADIKKIQNNN